MDLPQTKLPLMALSSHLEVLLVCTVTDATMSTTPNRWHLAKYVSLFVDIMRMHMDGLQ